jgi:hypothetical protein
MLQLDPQFARSDVLRYFNHAQIYLCLGSAITTIGLLIQSWAATQNDDLTVLVCDYTA